MGTQRKVHSTRAAIIVGDTNWLGENGNCPEFVDQELKVGELQFRDLTKSSGATWGRNENLESRIDRMIGYSWFGTGGAIDTIGAEVARLPYNMRLDRGH